MPNTARRSRGQAASSETIRLTELPMQGLLELACTQGADLISASVNSVLSPPEHPLTARMANPHRLMALAPYRWLLCTGLPPESDLERIWSAHILPIAGTAVDVSHAWRRFGISGLHARDLLAKGTAIDLRPIHFSPGECRQTLFARTPAILFNAGDDTFEVFIATSYSDWTWNWLQEAIREFQIDDEVR